MNSEISIIHTRRSAMAFLPYLATFVSSTFGIFAWLLADVLLNAWQVYDGYGSLVLVDFLYWAGLIILVAELLAHAIILPFTQGTGDWVKTHFTHQKKLLGYSLGGRVLIFGVILIIGQPLTFDVMGEIFPLVTDPEMETPGLLTRTVIATYGTWGVVTNSVPHQGLAALVGTWGFIAGTAISVWLAGLIKNSMRALVDREAIRS